MLVTTPGHFVGLRDGRIVVRRQKTVIAEMPCMRLRSLTLARRGVSLSSDLVCFCADQDVHIHFMDGLGRVLAVVYPPSGRAAEVAAAQIQHAHDALGRQLARMIVLGKVCNQFALLKYFGKYRKTGGGAFAEKLLQKWPDLKVLVEKIHTTPDMTDAAAFKLQLMGLEGAFGAQYWQLVGLLLPPESGFSGRCRRGATDLVNSLLNYGYGILHSRVLNQVIRTGLNPIGSFLHSYQAGKPTLVFDLMEEFRACCVDRAVFTLINRKEALALDADSRLTEATRKKLATAVLNRLKADIPYRGRRRPLEQVIQYQVDQLKQVLMQGGTYRPFLAKW